MAIQKRVIVVYGDSIFLRGIAITLRANPDLEIMEMHPGDETTCLGAARPDIVLVDAAKTSSDKIAALLAALHAQPGLPVLSLSAADRQLTIHSSRQYPAASLADLAQVLEKLSATLPNS